MRKCELFLKSSQAPVRGTCARCSRSLRLRERKGEEEAAIGGCTRAYQRRAEFLSVQEATGRVVSILVNTNNVSILVRHRKKRNFFKVISIFFIFS